MADRESVFGNPEVQRVLRQNFIPLAMNDWYLRRQQDEAGEFFRRIADQGPRKGQGGTTRQGRYAFTASGILLGYNNNRSVERILTMLREALAEWGTLSDAERRPKLPATTGETDKRFVRTAPQGGAIVKVHTRILEKKGDLLQRCSAADATTGGGTRGVGAAIDHLWIKPEEYAALLPTDERPVALPAEMVFRIARWHLTDNTRGEPPFWDLPDVREAAITLAKQPDGTVRMSGTFHMETPDGTRGFRGRLVGTLQGTRSALTKWEAVVLGDHWGAGPYTPGARPGKSPLGFAFSLVAKPTPADLLPPQAAHWSDGYWRANQR